MNPIRPRTPLPRYRPVLPAMPSPSPYPQAPGIGSSAGINEQDMAAHVGRQMAAFSPMARAGQDAAMGRQAAANVATVAAGDYGYQPVGRIGIAGAAPPAAPPRIGLRLAPPATATPALSPALPVTPTATAPTAMAPVPGRDVPFVPSVIEPQKNPWRPDQGSATANWRLHPGMVPPPAAASPQVNRTIRGAMARGVADVGIARASLAPPESVAPAGSLEAHLNNQIQQASQAGDFDALARAMGQAEAYRNHGADGLMDHAHKTEMAAAQREQAGAKIGLLDRSQGGRIGISPEQAHQTMLAKTGDPQAANEAYQWARINQAEAESKATGQPIKVNPNDAGMILARKYPAVAGLLEKNPKGKNPKGNVTGGSIGELHDALKIQSLPGWDDPRSELGQALVHGIRQAYGNSLANELWVPPSPAENRATGNVTPPEKSALPDFIDRPLNAASEWFGGVLNNASQNSWTLRPGAKYAAPRPGVDWFNRMTKPQ